MKWRLAIAVWAFAFVSFSSSVPVNIQDDFAAMYPVDYFPAYFQNDIAKIDIDFAKWFRNAASSVKHFYNYVNTLIFGRNDEREPIIGRYPTFKENNNAEAPYTNDTQPQELGINLPHIQAFEIYKDDKGKLIMRNLNNQNQNAQVLQDMPTNSISELNKSMNFLLKDDVSFRQLFSKLAKNPFQWNEKLEKDELFSGAFQNYFVNPELLWHSGIFPFQPINAFNVAGQSVQFSNQSTEAPSVSHQPDGTKVENQQIDQNQSSISEKSVLEVTTITEEFQSNENSDFSNDETPSREYGSQYEIVMDIERIKNNHSDSESGVSDDKSKVESDTTEASDLSLSDENDEMKSETADADLTELDTMQISTSDEESDESDKNNQEPEAKIAETSDSEQDFTTETDVNKSEVDNENSTPVIETSTSSQSEKKSKRIVENFVVNVSQDSEESDIAKKVLAIMNSR